jgi:hypothetical protein
VVHFTVLQTETAPRLGEPFSLFGDIMKVTVFGGAQPMEGSPAYQEALDLGRLLAQGGHIVVSGGYIGTMEAVSRGASEAGGHVIGVTCEDIEAWRKVKPNAWVKEEVRKKTLMERLQVLVEECDAAMALPGGVGTLVEISLMWNLMIVESMHRRPLILIGGGWQSVMDQFFDEFEMYMPKNPDELIQFAENVQAAVKMLNQK